MRQWCLMPHWDGRAPARRLLRRFPLSYQAPASSHSGQLAAVIPRIRTRTTPWLRQKLPSMELRLPLAWQAMDVFSRL